MIDPTEARVTKTEELGRKAPTAREALAELVACKDLKELADSNVAMEDAIKAQMEYNRRKPLAWAAARAALAAAEPVPREPTENMTEAGIVALSGTPTTICASHLDDAWRAMYDAATKQSAATPVQVAIANEPVAWRTASDTETLVTPADDLVLRLRYNQTGLHREAAAIEERDKIIAVLRRDLADPPGDVQELVVRKLDLVHRDAIAALQAEVARLTSEKRAALGQADDAEARTAAAEGDAQRYRIISAGEDFVVYAIDTGDDGTGIKEVEIPSDQLDAAADEAIAAQGAP